MRKIFVVALLIVAVLPLFVSLAGAEVAASVRYINVESITYEDDFPFRNSNLYPDAVPCTHFVYTFAMWKVNQWSDRAYYVAYVIRDKVQVVVAKWSVGFSVAGGLQGIYIDSATDLLSVTTFIAEFPYTTDTLTNTIDGTQAYRFYRMHFYFNGSLFKTEQVTVAADYMKDPSSSTTRSLSIGGITKPTLLTGDSASYRIQKTNPLGFKFHEVQQK